jgi:hypothetical protein
MTLDNQSPHPPESAAAVSILPFRADSSVNAHSFSLFCFCLFGFRYLYESHKLCAMFRDKHGEGGWDSLSDAKIFSLICLRIFKVRSY